MRAADTKPRRHTKTVAWHGLFCFMPKNLAQSISRGQEQSMNIINTVFDPIILLGILFIGYYAIVDFFDGARSRIAGAVRLHLAKGQLPNSRERQYGPKPENLVILRSACRRQAGVRPFRTEHYREAVGALVQKVPSNSGMER